MTITIPSPTHNPLPVMPKRSTRGGYTMMELMMSTALSAVILTGVLSSFMYLSRSGATMQSYNDMEMQSRRGLEIFAEDVRQASNITWDPDSSNSFVLVVNTASITYSYNSGTRAFSRQDPTGTKVLITGITPNTFVFRAFKLDGTELSLANTTDRSAASINTKQVQISLEASRSRSTLATSTNKVLSARYILRNKPVTA